MTTTTGTGTAALVLVHGLFSSGKTWKDLSDRIAEDDDLAERFHVFLMEYASPKFQLNPTRAIPDYNVIARSLRAFLDVEIGAYDKVVLVSHSQGGLIVQRYLSSMLAEGQGHALARIKSVVMLACPNSGSELAISLRRMMKIWRNPQERQLRPLNEQITEARSRVLSGIQYAKEIGPNSCPIPLHVYAGESDGIVTPSSACDVFPNAKALPGDHFTILHAKTSRSRTFTTLRHHLLLSLSALELDPEPSATALESRAYADSAHSGPRHNLVAPVDFFNRQVEFDRVIEGLLARGRTITMISGLGGIGKSALANKVAWEIVKSRTPLSFDHVVWHSHVPGAESVDALIDSIAEVLEYPYLRALPPAQKSTKAVEHLNRSRSLVIIDNLDDEDSPLSEVISRIDPESSKVIITSRRRDTNDRWPVDLNGLDYTAVSELVSREGNRLNIPSLVSDSAEDLESYKNATGGNPLAIRLTAAQMRYSGEKLETTVSRLTTAGNRDLFGTIFDSAWSQLSSHDSMAVEVVLITSLHSRTASPEAIAHVLQSEESASRNAIDRAVRSSLVDIVWVEPHGSGRLALHPLTRSYALYVLESDPPLRQRIQDRMIDYYRTLVAGNRHINGNLDCVAELAREREEILTIAQTLFAVASETRDSEKLRIVQEIGEGMTEYLSTHGYWQEHIVLAEISAAAAASTGSQVEEIRALTLAGRISAWWRRTEEAERYLSRSEAVLEDLDSSDEFTDIARLRGQVRYLRGDFDGALHVLRTVLDKTADSLAANDRAAILTEIGRCEIALEDFESADISLRQSYRLADTLGLIEEKAFAASLLAELDVYRGNFDSARTTFERVLGWSMQAGLQAVLARSLQGLAKVAVATRDLRRAQSYASRAREVYLRLGITESAHESQSIVSNLPGGVQQARLGDLLTKCRAVIFDFDDTLAATSRSRWVVLRRTAAEFGVDVTSDAIRAAWGLPFEALIAALVPTLDAEEFITRYRVAMLESPPASLPGVKSLLTGLALRRVRCLIVGSGNYSLILQDLDALGLSPFFDERDIFGSEQTTVHKPDPRVLKEPMDALVSDGFDREHIVLVGDSERDFRAATGNRVPFIGVMTGLDDREDFVRYGVAQHLVVGDLTQLLPWISTPATVRSTI
ncbi:alpha/beta fold hydrolase [Nocardia jiangsuensis]|uniref:Alpha/beta fold hydrolase n=1 Tax=Nocardia jiangsuensis TaxID=1691563 RepID=A0ABV8DZV7_9NOCA